MNDIVAIPVTTHTDVLEPAQRFTFVSSRLRGTVGDALESDRAPYLVAAVGAGLTLLIGIASVLRTTEAARPVELAVTLLGALGLALSLSFCTANRATNSVATAVAIATVTALAARMFGHAPTVVWLFAFVIPAVGLVRGSLQGALAGVLSEPALHWIEMGTPVDPVDPQAAFGFLILGALGAVPAYFLSVAITRRIAVRTQLDRVEALLDETKAAHEAERDAQRQAVFMLARAAEARDGTTGLHIVSVRDLAADLALGAGLERDDVQKISWSAMLHDVGKLRVPDRVLLKPGGLNDEEWELIRQHPAWGEELLSGNEGFKLARQIARSHHENWDGTGYPDRLAGEAIPFPARIVRVVDVFDALRSPRPYKAAWPVSRVLDELRAMRGKGLDPALTDLFIDRSASSSWGQRGFEVDL